VVLDFLGGTRLLVILRGDDEGMLVASAGVLAAAGVGAMEVSLSTAAGLGALRTCVRTYREVAWGAGTVLDRRQASDALEAGARYLVTPAVLPEVLAEGGEQGAPVLCGALTPTEVVTAWRSGAAAVKIFPARVFGPEYLRDLRGPLPEIPLIPVGGIGVGVVKEYLTSGAAAVGVGSTLVGDALRGGDLSALAERAGQYLAEVL
jgi:2-dehydro-3-deoxyphosphogluconate aldolase / (4S)-4-hydroxy-2-oxoglutarate aldolase